MTVKEVSQCIYQELNHLYPDQEIESFTYLIFNHFMGFKRFDVNLKSGIAIPSDIEIQIYDIIKQLKHNKPIQYILAETEFYGLPFYVDESVLIPRPETEELVQWILDDYRGGEPRIIDIGTGSGCIPITLAKNIQKASVFALDISEDAIITAQKNAKRNEVHVEFLKHDILQGEWPNSGLFDIVVSNPPYVTLEQKDRMDENVLAYEPHVALFTPENDPLIFYKAIAKFAKKQLKAGGCLYFEINETLSSETAEAVAQVGFATELKRDINGKYRMLKATQQ